MASLRYWLWLSALRGVSNLQKLSLLEHFCEPDAVYYGEREEYLLVDGMTKGAAEALEQKSLDEAERIWGECDRLGLRILTIRDAEYPDRLRNIYDPPIVLYVRGRLPRFDEEVAIAMVGTRSASPASLAGAASSWRILVRWWCPALPRAATPRPIVAHCVPAV